MSHTCGITGRRQELPCINCDCESSDRPDGSKVPTDEEMELGRRVITQFEGKDEEQEPEVQNHAGA